MQIQNHPTLKKLRRELRNRPTDGEHLLWYQLRGAKLDGRKFRRQHSVGPYILDFYCPEERLAIELDGNVHDEPAQQAHDKRRTEYLNENRITVLRFPSGQASTDPQAIIDEIRKTWAGRER
jgi:very-short-patch-repair endonuclease